MHVRVFLRDVQLPPPQQQEYSQRDHSGTRDIKDLHAGPAGGREARAGFILNRVLAHIFRGFDKSLRIVLRIVKCNPLRYVVTCRDAEFHWLDGDDVPRRRGHLRQRISADPQLLKRYSSLRYHEVTVVVHGNAVFRLRSVSALPDHLIIVLRHQRRAFQKFERSAGQGLILLVGLDDVDVDPQLVLLGDAHADGLLHSDALRRSGNQDVLLLLGYRHIVAETVPFTDDRDVRRLRPVVGVGYRAVDEVGHGIADLQVDGDLAIVELVILRCLDLADVEEVVILPVRTGLLGVGSRNEGIDRVDAVHGGHDGDIHFVATAAPRVVSLVVELELRLFQDIARVVGLLDFKQPTDDIDVVPVRAGVCSSCLARQAKTMVARVVIDQAVALLANRHDS